MSEQKTLEIDITITKSEDVKKTINLPYYSKTKSNEFFKVLGKDSYDTTRVRWQNGNINYISIDNAYNFNKAVGSDSEECTQEEYDNAFNEAQKFLFMQNVLSVENMQLKKPLLEFLEGELTKCNELDGEGIIWWSKIINIVKMDLYKLNQQQEA